MTKAERAFCGTSGLARRLLHSQRRSFLSSPRLPGASGLPVALNIQRWPSSTDLETESRDSRKRNAFVFGALMCNPSRLEREGQPALFGADRC